MSAGLELIELSDNLNDTRRNVKDLRIEVRNIEDTVADVRQTLEYAARIEEDAKGFIRKIDGMQAALKIAEKVGPLKLFAIPVGKVLVRLEDVAEAIRDEAHRINEKVVNSGFYMKLEEAEGKLADFQDDLATIETELSDYQDNVDSVAETLDFIGAPLNGLSTSIDNSVAPINDALVAINTTYDTIEAEVAALKSKFNTALLAPLSQVAYQFQQISNSLAFLKGPLDAVYSALQPIQPVLNAVGFIYDITVGPVVNWLLDSLGITAILDAAADKIAWFLPDPAALDGIFDTLDGIFSEIDEFLAANGLNTDIAGFIDDIRADFMDALGPGGDGNMRVGGDGSETMVGRENFDDVLNARGGDDTVYGLSGDDVLLASVGNDVLYGGDGEDRVKFKGNFSAYTFSQAGEGGPIVFQHNAPYGQKSTGLETIYDVERFVFADARFTLTQLVNNVFVATGPILNGTGRNDFLYGAASPVTINGRGGADRFTGSAFADVLNGGKGNDIFISGVGADQVNGGKGSDTWLLPDNPRNTFTRVDLVAGEAWDGDGLDTLTGIENVTIQDSRDVELFGDARGNTLTASGGRDLIDGRNGNDKIYGNEGRDILIGGRGTDRVFGGDDVDILLAGARRGDTNSDRYDGGDGFDILAYSRNIEGVSLQTPSGRDVQAPDSENRLRIFAETGTIERLDGTGQTVVATDRALNIERFVGSEQADELHGWSGTVETPIEIDGAGGDDVIYSNGSRWTYGGDGDDLVHVTPGQISFHGTGFDGGGGFDTLDTRLITDARWSIRLSGALGSSFNGYKAEYSGGLGSAPGSSGEVVSIGVGGNLKNFERIYLGAFDDEVWLQGSGELEVFGGDGDDRLVRAQPVDGSARGTMRGEGGDDYLRLDTDGALYGGEGNDELYVYASGVGHVVDAGRDDDFLTIRRMEGSVNGGQGYDVVSFDLLFTTVVRNTVDLDAGTFQNLRFSSGFATDDINGTISNVEELIGDNETRDEFFGRDNAVDRFIGRGGDDRLVGRGGRDELFGGAGNDVLEGGDGNDVLHGGLGNDTINGGEGVDTVSYVNAAPDGARGEMAASGFGGVTVDLAAGTASGGFGNDTLIGIENVVGSRGNDILRGDAGRTVLSGGGDGQDTLDGRAGNDVLLLGNGLTDAFGGDGNDLFIVNNGGYDIDGGAGRDTLDLGAAEGHIELDFGSGRYVAEGIGFYVSHLTRPWDVWADTGTSEMRTFNGQDLFPYLVRQAEVLFADSPDDLARVLPGINDPLFSQFLIRSTELTSLATAYFDSIEKVVGGAASVTIIASNDRDTYDGTLSPDDVLDLSGFTSGVDFNLATGASNNSRLDGDTFTGLEQIDGTGFDDTLRADGGDNTLNGSSGADTLDGRRGDDTLNGGFGDDILIGGIGDDALDGGNGFDIAEYGGNRADYLVEMLNANTWQVTALSGPDGTDTLKRVERLSFADAFLDL